jgi:hypothetical protein
MHPLGDYAAKTLKYRRVAVVKQPAYSREYPPAKL